VLEILAKLPFDDMNRAALNILMADPKRQYEVWAQIAQRNLARLVLALAQTQIEEAV
jgi:hypothetical protein